MKFIDQSHAGDNKYGPEQHGPDNAPEQDFMLIPGVYLEVGEYQYKNKQVVDAERLFDQVGGKKLKRFLVPEVFPDPQVKSHSQQYPEQTEEQCLFHPDFMRLPIEKNQIEQEH